MGKGSVMPMQWQTSLLAQQVHIWTATCMVCTKSGQMYIVIEYASSMAEI